MNWNIFDVGDDISKVVLELEKIYNCSTTMRLRWALLHIILIPFSMNSGRLIKNT